MTAPTSEGPFAGRVSLVLLNYMIKTFLLPIMGLQNVSYIDNMSITLTDPNLMIYFQ